MRDLAFPRYAALPRQHLAAATLGLGLLHERRGDTLIRVPVHRRQQSPDLEWHARQEGGRLVHLTFTAETLEEWSALAAASPAETLGLYRDLLARPEVRADDLLWRHDVFARGETGPVLAFAAGTYNPFNPWNTVRGAVHLTRPAPGPRGVIALRTEGILFLGNHDVTSEVLRPRRRDDRTGRVTRLEVEAPAGALYDLDDLSLPGGDPLTPLGLAHHLLRSGEPARGDGVADRLPRSSPGVWWRTRCFAACGPATSAARDATARHPGHGRHRAVRPVSSTGASSCRGSPARPPARRRG
ncbi:hypothetical protein ACE7GA_04450 [Roseomonas sp. CCTCC AB2023176]|uniref:hypothetical protein n=1 Tax=Roseomonas sp. CCTCC AB2023176 TaxID=3342640 RepID=UPI0035E1A480